jgi:hypothetical protein
LHHLKNLNNINVSGWAKNEIVHIIREQNAEIAWALDSRKSHIQRLIFSDFMRQSITARWSIIPWDLCTVSARVSHKGNWRPMNFIPFEVFSMGVFVSAMVPPFLN